MLLAFFQMQLDFVYNYFPHRDNLFKVMLTYDYQGAMGFPICEVCDGLPDCKPGSSYRISKSLCNSICDV